MREAKEHASGVPEPLIAFVNANSGGKMGRILFDCLSSELGREHVFDLGEGPAKGLQAFAGKPFRIAVCGGDGTVNWILSSIDLLKIQPVPAVGILPLGTGNDTARHFGWGHKYQSEKVIRRMLRKMRQAPSVPYDRWHVFMGHTEPIPESMHSAFPPLISKHDPSMPPAPFEEKIHEAPLQAPSSPSILIPMEAEVYQRNVVEVSQPQPDEVVQVKSHASETWPPHISAAYDQVQIDPRADRGAGNSVENGESSSVGGVDLVNYSRDRSDESDTGSVRSSESDESELVPAASSLHSSSAQPLLVRAALPPLAPSQPQSQSQSQNQSQGQVLAPSVDVNVSVNEVPLASPTPTPTVKFHQSPTSPALIPPISDPAPLVLDEKTDGKSSSSSDSNNSSSSSSSSGSNFVFKDVVKGDLVKDYQYELGGPMFQAQWNNYLSFGLDAQVMYRFHRHREAHRSWYCCRPINMCSMGICGACIACSCAAGDIHLKVEIRSSAKAPWRVLDLPHGLSALVLLNLEVFVFDRVVMVLLCRLTIVVAAVIAVTI